MITKETIITIVGLGLLGGSYAQGLSNAGYSVYGIDIDPEAVSFAKENGWIIDGSDDPASVSNSEIVIFALYPQTFVGWIRQYQDLLPAGCIITDVTGVKRNVIAGINAVLRPDVEYIAAHPMAGREFKGIQYADSSRFRQANYIIVATKDNTEKAIAAAREIAEILQFRFIGELTPEDHDRMIGFLSQLTHVIAVSLMNVSDNPDLVKYTGDSFRDLTRIANINADLWPELFIENKDYLMKEIDLFMDELTQFRQMIDEDNVEGMKEKMIISTERRKAFDR